MKLLAAVALVLLYAFTVWMHLHYRDHRRDGLVQEARQNLIEADLAHVKLLAEHGMDAELHGYVLSESDRTTAQALVDRIHGLRSLDQDNHLIIPGFIHTKKTDDGTLTIVGEIGSRAAADQLISSLAADGSYAKLETDSLRVEDGRLDPSFTNSEDYHDLMESVHSTPGSSELRASDSGFLIRANGTEDLQRVWTTSTQALGRGADPDLRQAFELNVEEDVTLYPSLYHVPGYQYESVLPEDRLSALTRVLSLSNVFFESGSTSIQASEMNKLQQAADEMMKVGNRGLFVVGGHADSTGSREQNQRISFLRAQAVANQLTQFGVLQEQLKIVSFGSSGAVGNQATEKARAQSRRVEIRLR
ncbi:MAG: OmpA family protein [Verrucomicrobiota bacterium]